MKNKNFDFKNYYNQTFDINSHNNIIEFGNIEGSFNYFKLFGIKKDENILDIGTNIGSFPHQLFLHGWQNVIGIDICDKSIEFGCLRYETLRNALITYDGVQLPFPDNHFDVITMFDVIEHIPSLKTYLHEVSRVTKENGLLIFQTPNIIYEYPINVMFLRSFTEPLISHCSLQSLFSLKNNLTSTRWTNITIDKFALESEYYYEKVKIYSRHFEPILLKVVSYFLFQFIQISLVIQENAQPMVSKRRYFFRSIIKLSSFLRYNAKHMHKLCLVKFSISCLTYGPGRMLLKTISMQMQ